MYGMWILSCKSYVVVIIISIIGGGGCTSRGGCEIPRPYLEDFEQAQEILLISKIILTSDHQTPVAPVLY